MISVVANTGKLQYARLFLHRHYFHMNGYNLRVRKIWDTYPEIPGGSATTKATKNGLLDEAILWALDEYGY